MAFSRPASATRTVRAWTVGIGLWLCLAPATSLAGPPDDEWTLETERDDALLVEQRLGKLRRNPFDDRQWRALEKALGPRRLARRLAAAAARDPGDVALAILDARASLSADPGRSAARLAAIEPRAGRWRPRVLALRVDALQAADRPAEAIAALEGRAGELAGKEAEALRQRAFQLADRAGLSREALRLARTLADARPGDADARIRLAEAAGAAREHAAADAAWTEAIAASRPSARPELVARRARARLDAGDPTRAAALALELLDGTPQAGAGQREAWWQLLESAHRAAGTSETLARALQDRLRSGGAAREAAAWRTLARAQAVAGADPVPAWRRALAIDPGDADSRGELIRTLEAAGDTQGVFEEYRNLVTHSRHEAQLGLEMARRLITNGDRDTGLRLAEEIEQRAGKRGNTLLLLLEFYNDLDDPDRALEVARKLARVQPRDPDARVALGEQLFQMGHRREAEEQWRMLPSLVRPDHAGWARYAEILAEHAATRGHGTLRRDAEAALGRALALAPDNAAYLRLRALLHEDQGQTKDAWAAWEKVRRNASRPDQRLLREEARTRVVEILFGGAHLPGRAQIRHRAVLDAQAELDRGASPEALEAGLFLAELHSREEAFAQAVATLTRMTELWPGDADLLAQLAAAQRRTGAIADVRETLVQLMEIDPSRRADVLAELSEVAFEVGDADEALAAATRAATDAVEGRRALVRLGELHEREGDLDRALEAYRRALASAPGDASARLHIAELQLTRGDASAAFSTLREILLAGGNPEIVRQAGRRALDLAEASGDTGALLDLAVKRAQRDLEGDEPRDFLLETLERVDAGSVRAWLDADREQTRASGLRRSLVAALARGPVGTRQRAAQHLGALRLPGTALPLARMGTQLTTPRDATPAVARAFEHARAAAIRAAGELDDPAVVSLLAPVLAGRRAPTEGERIATAWALARSSDPAALDALRREIAAPHDDAVVGALACIGLSLHSRGRAAGQDRIHALEEARSSRHAIVQEACSFASAALLPDARVDELVAQLDRGDPMPAAIAAWRLGRSVPEGARGEIVEALFRRWLGPPGLPRDAAGAALARLLGGPLADLPPPTAPGGAAELALSQWLRNTVAPEHDPVPAGALRPWTGRIVAALEANATGTPAERLASERARKATCGGAPDPGRLCLSPLADGAVELPGRVDKPPR
jgi:tetratricopeptide (TPR) repeat protein